MKDKGDDRRLALEQRAGADAPDDEAARVLKADHVARLQPLDPSLWADIGLRVLRSIPENRLLATAGGVAFFALMATLNINLPHVLFFTLYPSPDIRMNYGTPVHNQTGRLFLPLNFMVGWKPTEHTVISAEFGIPIIRDFPVYTFKTQLRVGYLF